MVPAYKDCVETDVSMNCILRQSCVRYELPMVIIQNIHCGMDILSILSMTQWGKMRNFAKTVPA